MIKNISAWKISSLNEYSVQIRLGSNLGGFFYFRKKEDAYGRKTPAVQIAYLKKINMSLKRAIRIILIALFFFKHNVRRRLTEKALHTGILC